MNESNTNTFSQASGWLVGTARRNPEALLLLAAGCALMMRSGGGFARAREDADGWTHEDGYSTASPSVRSGESRFAERGSSSFTNVKDRVTSAASEYASGMQDRISGTAAGYADSISSRVTDTANSVADAARSASQNMIESSQSMRRQAQATVQGTIEGVLRDQPLAVAALGFVAGAAIAAAFPATAVESRALGGARESLSDAVGAAGRKVMSAADEAGERLKAAAKEKGLTADGAKDVARQVAGAFTDAVSSGDQGKGSRESAVSSSKSAATTNMAASDDSGPGDLSGGLPR